jgi:hypothetical protein
VRDRAAEGALGRGALDVDVDPLVVTGRVGEQVDVLLGDLVPVAAAEVGADESGTSAMVVVVVMRAWSSGSRGRDRAPCNLRL